MGIKGCMLLLALASSPSALLALVSSAPEHSLITWKGETLDPDESWDPLNLTQTHTSGKTLPFPASRSWVEMISWQPRALVYHNFISAREARHLIELAAPQMKRSTVVGEGGKSVEDEYRTSYGTFLRRYQDLVVERIENRVAAWTHIPVAHQEDTQILRYGIGQFYKVHGDTLVDDEAGVRVGTVLIYLNDPEEGGETAFPDSKWLDPELKERFGPFSECAANHVAFKPKRGDALLFWSIQPDGRTEDYHAMHTGCPVIKGVKWTATKWVHAKPFRPHEMASAKKHRNSPDVYPDPGVCEDEHPECDAWAKRGDCDKNRDYMVVGPAQLGACRRACGACRDCQPGDKECYNDNRRQVGYLVFNPDELMPVP